MPTPRTSGAELVSIPLTVPGFKGLNTQAAQGLLGPEWATRLENTVLDQNNRVAGRKGYDSVSTGPSTGNIIQVIEYLTTTGTTELVASTASFGGRIEVSTDGGGTWSNATGTATVSDTNMQLVNFNDSVIGFQAGASPIIYSGSAASDLTDSGNEPDGGIGLAAFGRLWAADDDGITLRYCALLDETDWSGSDAGTFSLQNVWSGYDEITALAEFNGALVVFGRENIVIFTDGQGSAVGLDPLRAYVVDTISGIGCIARDSVVNVKGDLWFLSADGLQSLGRLIQEKSNPLVNLSLNVQDRFLQTVNRSDVDLTRVRAVYSPEERFYLISFTVGTGTTENGEAWAFDTRGRLEDGSARVMGIWTRLVPRALTRRRDGQLLFSLWQNQGVLFEYTEFDDSSGPIPVSYESGWLDLTQQSYTIIPKRVAGVFVLGQDTDLDIKWAFDFETAFTTRTVTFTGIDQFSEFGISEFAEAEFGGGGSALRNTKVPGAGSGEYIKIGFDAETTTGSVAVQQLEVFAKIGRLR